MKVYWYSENLDDGLEVGDDTECECYYIPDENIILYKKEHRFRGVTYTYTDGSGALDFAKRLVNGEAERYKQGALPGMKKREMITEPTEFDMDISEIQAMIERIRAKVPLDEKVENDFENLEDKTS